MLSAAIACILTGCSDNHAGYDCVGYEGVATCAPSATTTGSDDQNVGGTPQCGSLPTCDGIPEEWSCAEAQDALESGCTNLDRDNRGGACDDECGNPDGEAP